MRFHVPLQEAYIMSIRIKAQNCGVRQYGVLDGAHTRLLCTLYAEPWCLTSEEKVRAAPDLGLLG